MKKCWSYIAAVLAGVIGGMVLLWQLVKGLVSTTNIQGKIKQKGTHNSRQDIRTDMNLNTQNSAALVGSSKGIKDKKLQRRQKRAAKKAKQKLKKQIKQKHEKK